MPRMRRIGRLRSPIAYAAIVISLLITASASAQTCQPSQIAVVDGAILQRCDISPVLELRGFCKALAKYPEIDQAAVAAAVDRLQTAFDENRAAGRPGHLASIRDHINAKIAGVRSSLVNPSGDKERGAALQQVTTLRAALDILDVAATDTSLLQSPDREHRARGIQSRLNALLAIQARLLRLRAAYEATLGQRFDGLRPQVQPLFNGHEASLSQLADTQVGFLAQLREWKAEGKDVCFLWTDALVRSLNTTLGRLTVAPPSLPPIPTEIPVEIAAPSLIAKFAFGVEAAKREGNRVTARIAWDLLLGEKEPRLRIPLGLTFEDAIFDTDAPQNVTVPPSRGTANVALDPNRLAAAIAAVLPLPDGFFYRTALEHAPSGLDGTTVKVVIEGPGPLGSIFEAKLVLDRSQPDGGFRSLIDQMMRSGQAPATARTELVETFHAAARARIKDFLNTQRMKIGLLQVSEIGVDWERWDRGNHAFSAGLDWSATDASLRRLLPTAAELRIDSDGQPRLSLPPLDPEPLRRWLAEKAVSKVYDTAMLNRLIERFGAPASDGIPLGWVRVRNAVVDTRQLAAEIAFAIGDEQPRWVALRVELPPAESHLASSVDQLVSTANEAIAAYAKRFATDAVYSAAESFVQTNPAQTFPLFGVNFTIALVRPLGPELPPKPIVRLTATDPGIVITGVGMTISDGKPVFDLSAAHLQGLNLLADRILAKAKLGAGTGDLALTVTDLAFSGDRLAGRVRGRFQGYEFIAPFSIGQADANVALPSLRVAMISALQRAMSDRRLSLWGLELSGFRMCPEGDGKAPCDGDRIGASATYTIPNMLAGEVTFRIHPTLDIQNFSQPKSLPGLAGLTGLFRANRVTINPIPKLSPLEISGSIDVGNVFGIIPVGEIEFRWSAISGISIGGPRTISIPTDVPIPPGINLSSIKVPLGKDQDGNLAVGVVMTVGLSLAKTVFNIDGTLRANPDAQRLELEGLASVLMLPLYQVKGTLDIPAKEAVSEARTLDPLAEIIQQGDRLRISGQDCVVAQANGLKFLFIDIKGELILQVPPTACGAPVSTAASACGLTSKGGLCLSALANFGPFGHHATNVLASFDMTFTGRTSFQHQILGQGVAMDLEVGEALARVRAHVLGLKLEFVAKDPFDIEATLKKLIDRLLKPDIDIEQLLKGKIQISLDNGKTFDVEITPDAQPGEPSSAPAPNGGAPSPVTANGVPGAEGGAKGVSALPTPKETATMNAERRPPSAVTTLLREPNALVTFDEQNYLVVTDLDGGNKRRSQQSVEAGSRAIVESGCIATLGWISAGRGTFDIPDVDIVDAGAVVFGTAQAGCAPLPKACNAQELCALRLRNVGDSTGALSLLEIIDWIDQPRTATGAKQATRLQRRMVLDLAHARLFPGEPRVLAEAQPWPCLHKIGDDCALALERYQNDVQMIAFDEGMTAKISPQSLLAWTLKLDDQLAVRRELLQETASHKLFVLAQAPNAWLTTPIKTDGLTADATLISRSKGTGLRVALVNSHGSMRRIRPWLDVSLDDTAVTAAVELMAKESEARSGPWFFDDLGVVSDGRRILMQNGQTVYLVASDGRKICSRKALLDEVGRRLKNTAVAPWSNSEPNVTTLRSFLTLATEEWRQQGLTENPVMVAFGNDCHRP